MERDLELNLILLWFICIELKQCVQFGFCLFILFPRLPQVLAENCFVEIMGCFGNSLSLGKNKESFIKFWRSSAGPETHKSYP